MMVRCFPTLTYPRWWHLSISNYAYSPNRPILSDSISVVFSLIWSSDSFLHGLIQSMTKHARSWYWTLSLSYTSREFLFSDIVSLLSSYSTLFRKNNDLVQKLLTGWLKSYWKFIEYYVEMGLGMILVLSSLRCVFSFFSLQFLIS